MVKAIYLRRHQIIVSLFHLQLIPKILYMSETLTYWSSILLFKEQVENFKKDGHYKQK